MASSTEGGVGLSLHDAARQMGVQFAVESEPTDKNVQVNGMNFHYLEWGDVANPTILMLHGNSQQAHSWDFVSLALSDQYHILAMDQRGHGDSDWAAGADYRIDAFQGDIDGFVEAMGLDRFILFGHSMGGRNSYVWASRHPGALKALVIVDTGPVNARRGQDRMARFRELPDELDTFEEFAHRVIEYTGRSREQVLGALKYSIRQRSDGKWIWKADKIWRTKGRRETGYTADQLWDCVRKIECPTLVVRGSNSDVFPVETMQQMEEIIPGCETVTISGAGHLVQGDNPADFVTAVNKILDRVR